MDTLHVYSSPDVDVSASSQITSESYEIPPTPNVSSEDSFDSSEISRDHHKLVVLTRVTRFLPLHILNTLLTQEYTIRGVVTCADRADDVDALFAIHPMARKYLFIHQVSPLEQKDWERAFASADYVIHVVTPVAYSMPGGHKNESSLPAVEVTKNILRACVKVKTVQRIVLITSVASIAWSKHAALQGGPFKEDTWENENELSGYAKCQLSCERAAFDFFNCLAEADKIDFVVLNPAFVLGPMLQGKSTTTMGVVKALMESMYDRLPASTLPLVDVRDVAQAAAVALVKTEAVGYRHIIFCATISLEEMSAILDKEFTKQGYRVQTKAIPTEHVGNCGVCTMKQISPENYLTLPESTSIPIEYDNTRMRKVLSVEPRCPEETIIETAYSLIYWDMVTKGKPRKNRGPLAMFRFTGRSCFGSQKKRVKPSSLLL